VRHRVPSGFKRTLTQSKEAAVSTGLEISGKNNKVAYMKTNRNMRNSEQDMMMNGQILEEVQNFRYLDSLKKFRTFNKRLNTGASNRSFYSLRQIFRSRAMSKAVQIKI
jgi:hypothetical protein